jgi:hypothetical protein
MANTTIRALTTLAGSNIADADLLIMHDFSANTEVSVTPVALATALNSRLGAVGAANGIVISAGSTNTALTVTQTGTGNAFLVEDSTSPDATPFVVKADGRVGVGTLGPTNLMHVTTSNVAEGITLENTDAGASAGPRLVLYRNSASPAVSDALGVLYFMGNSTTTNGAIYATIGGFIDDNVSATENGRLTFTTRRDGADTTAMVIGSNGRIAIGPNANERTNAVLTVDRALNYNINGTFGILLSSTVQSDTAGASVTGILSNLTTQAATFTLNTLNHYSAQQSNAFGAGSTVTTQVGYSAAANLIGATTNYGFRSLNAAAVTTGRTHYGFVSESNVATGGGTAWNFFASGTAPNFFQGPVTVASVTNFAAGSAAAPSLTVTGDTNTGIFFPAADNIAVGTNGTERLRVDANGNVGIGITTPTASSRLHTYQTTSSALTPSITVGAAYTAGSLSHGVGFSINNNPVSAGLYVTEAGGAGAGLIFTTAANYTTPTNTERMRIHASGGVSIGNTTDPGATNLSVTGSGSFASVSATGVVATGLGAVGTPSHTFTGDLNTGIWSPGADTVAVSTGGAERLRIDNDGDVGIGGTANNAAILDLQSTTKGFLPPRMTTTQRNAIASPPPGLTIFNTTNSREEGFDGAQWIPRIPLDATEDYIINGGFDVWQRGTTSTAAGYVAADRWGNNFVGGTVTQSRQAFTIGERLGNNNPTFFLRQSVSGQTLTSQWAMTQQRIEGVRTYAGQTITVLGWAKRATAGNMAVEGFQNFGTGGTPSTEVLSIGVTTVALTTSWTPFAVVMTVPSVTTKVLGTAVNDYFGINFWSSAGTDYNARTNSLGLQTTDVDLWGIHVREGVYAANDALMYRQKDLVSEIAKCYRYYYRITAPAASHVLAPGYNTATTVTRNMIQFPVRMRAAPTAIEQTGVAANYLVFHGATTAACTAVPVFVSANELTAQISGTTGATLVAGQGSILGSNAIGAFLAWSAEL